MRPPSVAIEIENGGDSATPIKLAFLVGHIDLTCSWAREREGSLVRPDIDLHPSENSHVDVDPDDLSFQSVFNRIGGFGYRTISSLPHRQSPRIRRLLAMFTKRSMPLELWLGRGRPLNPYLKGSLVEWLRRDPRIFKCFQTKLVLEMLEISLRLQL